MILPNPAMDAVPFTPLTAEFLDNMIENIEAVAIRTAGYAERTTSYVSANQTQTFISPLSVTVTVPSGGARLKLTFVAPYVTTNAVSGATAYIHVWRGGVTTGTSLGEYIVTTRVGGDAYPVAYVRTDVPPAGSVTYNASMRVSSDTGTMFATATNKISLLAEFI